MIIAKARSLMLAVAIVVVSTGCVNWEAVERAQSAELDAMRAWTSNVGPLLQPPSGNAGESAHVAYQVRMAYIGQTLQQMKPDTLATVLSYAKSQNELWYRGLSLALNNPFSNALAQKWVGGGGASGGNSFDLSASDEATISVEGLSAGNRSPITQGDENLVGVGKPALSTDQAGAASNDGQVVQGEGNTTGQAVSRPNNQNDLEFAGDGGEGEGAAGGASDNNINSEGLGSGAGLDI